MIFLIYIILLGYVANIFWLYLGVFKLKTNSTLQQNPQTSFSIIVPFRNEAHNLPILLKSIENINYPKHLFEVLLINDNSNDGFTLQDYSFLVQIINSENTSISAKKNAILTGINHAKFQWIYTTDADCELPNNLFQELNSLILQQNVTMIAMPVSIKSNIGFLNYFQEIDFYSLQQTTKGSFGNKQAFMCNGANFAYTKAFFYELNGFEGNEKISSGDDVFLLQKALKTDAIKVNFLNNLETIVQTNAENSWKNLINQRVRWASKTNNYNSFYPKQLAVFVFLVNLIFVISFVKTIFIYSYLEFLFVFGIKLIIDSLFLQKHILNKYYLPTFFLYPFFTVWVVFKTFFGSYSWKERDFKV